MRRWWADIEVWCDHHPTQADADRLMELLGPLGAGALSVRGNLWSTCIIVEAESREAAAAKLQDDLKVLGEVPELAGRFRLRWTEKR